MGEILKIVSKKIHQKPPPLPFTWLVPSVWLRSNSWHLPPTSSKLFASVAEPRTLICGGCKGELSHPMIWKWHHVKKAKTTHPYECPANAVTPWSCKQCWQSMGNKSRSACFCPVNLNQYILPSGLCYGNIEKVKVSTTGYGNVWRSHDATVWTTYTTVLQESCHLPTFGVPQEHWKIEKSDLDCIALQSQAG